MVLLKRYFREENWRTSLMEISSMLRRVTANFAQGTILSKYPLYTKKWKLRDDFNKIDHRKPFSNYVYSKIQSREKDYKPKGVEREPYTGPVIQL